MKKNGSSGIKKATNQKIKDNSTFLDVMTIVIIAAYLFIDFLKYNERVEIIKPQFLYLNVLNVFVGIYIYFNPALHSNSLVSIFKKSYVFKLYLAFILLCGASIFVANNLSLGLNSFAEILVVFNMAINFSILLYNRLHLLYKLIFVIGVCAFVQGLQALLDFKTALGDKSILQSLETIYTIRGNTGNVNIFSASLIFKIPFLLIGITHFTNWKKWFLIATLAFATLIIFLISARASLISLLTIFIVYVVYYLVNNSINKQSLARIAYIVLPVIASFICVNIIFSQSNMGGRFSSTTERIRQINTNDGSVNLRLVYWKNALILTKKKPILGVGLGNWRIESIPHESSAISVISLHTHNDFLELTAETGIVNGLIYFSIFVFLLVINLKRLKTSQKNAKLITILALMLLIVYGVDALFNFPFYRATMQLCFSFLLAFTFVNTSIIDEKKGSLNTKNVVIALIIIAIIPLYVTYHGDKTSNLEYKIEADNIDFNSKGKLTGDEVVNQKPLFPNVFNTSEPFDEYAAIYYLREKNYEKALKHFNIAMKVNPYLGRTDFYRYIMANERGMPDSAYYYVKASFYARPANSNFFQQAVNTAASRRDTLEILKMYKTSAKVVENPSAWAIAANGLQLSGYSVNNLSKFLSAGIKAFPNDSTVRDRYNTTLITQYIIKGQQLYVEGKHEETLKTYMKGFKLDSTNVYVNQNIGFYYYNTGKPKQAIPYMLNSIKKPGLGDGKSEFYLGICYVTINDKINGCKYLSLAKAKNYQYADAYYNDYCSK